MGANPKISVEAAGVVAMPPTKQGVNIFHRQGQKPAVDLDVVELDRNNGGNNVEIVWTCDHPEKNFYICFKDGRSPFNSLHYSNTNNHTGTITKDAAGEYRYSVEIDGKVLDPTIIVRPS
jgi:hypothetical protein